jgi:hypothetical protein
LSERNGEKPAMKGKTTAKTGTWVADIDLVIDVDRQSCRFDKITVSQLLASNTTFCNFTASMPAVFDSVGTYAKLLSQRQTKTGIG